MRERLDSNVLYSFDYNIQYIVKLFSIGNRRRFVSIYAARPEWRRRELFPCMRSECTSPWKFAHFYGAANSMIRRANAPDRTTRNLSLEYQRAIYASNTSSWIRFRVSFRVNSSREIFKRLDEECKTRKSRAND